MKRKEFMEMMNNNLSKVHVNNGLVDTCNIMIFSAGEYSGFLNECFPDLDLCTSLNTYYFGKYWINLSDDEEKSIYQLRVALLAVFTAWALKTKAYRDW
jgi:hypothetical protein